MAVMGWTLLLLALLVGPVVWALTLGRRQRAPGEDVHGSTAGEVVQRQAHRHG